MGVGINFFIHCVSVCCTLFFGCFCIAFGIAAVADPFMCSIDQHTISPLAIWLCVSGFYPLLHFIVFLSHYGIIKCRTDFPGSTDDQIKRVIYYHTIVFPALMFISIVCGMFVFGLTSADCINQQLGPMAIVGMVAQALMACGIGTTGYFIYH